MRRNGSQALSRWDLQTGEVVGVFFHGNGNPLQRVSHQRQLARRGMAEVDRSKSPVENLAPAALSPPERLKGRGFLSASRARYHRVHCHTFSAGAGHASTLPVRFPGLLVDVVRVRVVIASHQALSGCTAAEEPGAAGGVAAGIQPPRTVRLVAADVCAVFRRRFLT